VRRGEDDASDDCSDRRSYELWQSRTDGLSPSWYLCGQILKAAKPADLAVVRATKFELVVKFKIAKTLGITMPTSILLRADEVIELGSLAGCTPFVASWPIATDMALELNVGFQGTAEVDRKTVQTKSGWF
jgi:hypothetical protein